MENDYPSTETVEVMSVKDWIITLILLAIPIANIIMLFLWAFSDDTNKTKQNFAKAQLLVMLIIIVVAFLISFIFGGFVALLGNMAG